VEGQLFVTEYPFLLQQQTTQNTLRTAACPILERIVDADTLEKLEALLPWNVKLERVSKKVPQFD
jgi:hypothetical protein